MNAKVVWGYEKRGVEMSEQGVKHITVPGLRLHLRRDDNHNILWIISQKVLILNAIIPLTTVGGKIG